LNHSLQFAETDLIAFMKQMHHFMGLNQDSNNGLAGVVEINGEKNIASKDVDETEASKYISLATKFIYNTDVKVDLLPYFNGRYLTELAFDFKHIFGKGLAKRGGVPVSPWAMPGHVEDGKKDRSGKRALASPQEPTLIGNRAYYKLYLNKKAVRDIFPNGFYFCFWSLIPCPAAEDRGLVSNYANCMV
jgi:hypothetical protein